MLQSGALPKINATVVEAPKREQPKAPAPVSDPAACKACKKKLCYACAKTTAEEYEEASPWYCPECNH